MIVFSDKAFANLSHSLIEFATCLYNRNGHLAITGLFPFCVSSECLHSKHLTLVDCFFAITGISSLYSPLRCEIHVRPIRPFLLHLFDSTKCTFLQERMKHYLGMCQEPD